MIGQTKKELSEGEEKRLLIAYEDYSISMTQLRYRFGIGDKFIFRVLKKHNVTPRKQREDYKTEELSYL